MKPATLSTCLGCVMAAMPFTQVYAQTTTAANTASLFLNGADFSIQLLSGTGSQGADPGSVSSASTQINGVDTAANDYSKTSISSAFVNPPGASASASTQGYSITESTQASKGLAYSQASYDLNYTAAAGAVFEISIPYNINLKGDSLGQADITTNIFGTNGSVQTLSDVESIETVDKPVTDSGYLDLLIRNTSGASENYVFSVTGQVQSISPIAPIPEPQTYLMLLSGLPAIAFVARRKA
jgi:hypothetical protein